MSINIDYSPNHAHLIQPGNDFSIKRTKCDIENEFQVYLPAGYVLKPCNNLGGTAATAAKPGRRAGRTFNGIHVVCLVAIKTTTPPVEIYWPVMCYSMFHTCVNIKLYVDDGSATEPIAEPKSTALFLNTILSVKDRGIKVT